MKESEEDKEWDDLNHQSLYVLCAYDQYDQKKLCFVWQGEMFKEEREVSQA